MGFNEDLNINHFRYPNPYYWDPNINPNAVWAYSLANCTTLAYGRAKECGLTAPVTVIRNANYWHLVVNTAENWTLLDYYEGMQLEAGDILEWSNPFQHVAICETSGSNPITSNSYYTGDNGSLTAGRTPSVIGGNTLQALSNYFSNRYPFRFYHYTNLSGENRNVGGQPTYVLRYTGEKPEPPTPPTPTLLNRAIIYFSTINKKRRAKHVKVYTE